MSEHQTLTQSDAAPRAGHQATLALRYVGSLYDLAEKENAIDAVAADMRGMRRLWDECAEWRFIACDPRLSNEAVGAAALEVSKMAKVGQLTANFLSVVAQNRRLSLLPALVDGFLEEVAKRRGEYRVDVRTAQALSASQRETLNASLSKTMGGKVHMNVREDPSILGGLTIKLGSQFIDASVKTKLEHLERSLRGAA